MVLVVSERRAFTRKARWQIAMNNSWSKGRCSRHDGKENKLNSGAHWEVWSEREREKNERVDDIYAPFWCVRGGGGPRESNSRVGGAGLQRHEWTTLTVRVYTDTMSHGARRYNLECSQPIPYSASWFIYLCGASIIQNVLSLSSRAHCERGAFSPRLHMQSPSARADG